VIFIDGDPLNADWLRPWVKRRRKALDEAPDLARAVYPHGTLRVASYLNSVEEPEIVLAVGSDGGRGWRESTYITVSRDVLPALISALQACLLTTGDAGDDDAQG